MTVCSNESSICFANPLFIYTEPRDTSRHFGYCPDDRVERQRNPLRYDTCYNFFPIVVYAVFIQHFLRIAKATYLQLYHYSGKLLYQCPEEILRFIV